VILDFIIEAQCPSDFTVTAEQFRSALHHWVPHVTLTEPTDGHDGGPAIDIVAVVQLPHELSFQIARADNDHQIWIRGTSEQAAKVAVWAVRSFSHTGGSELWITYPSRTGHAQLLPGMSPDEVWDDWLDHY
jgi:hypothetical protein